MTNDPYHDKDSITDLLKHYNNLRNGTSTSFFDEEAFEKVIDYFDDQEDLGRALEAAEMAIEYFPYSGALLIKKADLLLATRKYQDALDILERAELFDASDINLFILKTDAYLAMDQQDKAVELTGTGCVCF
jgi:predicted Zn-dependent protease